MVNADPRMLGRGGRPLGEGTSISDLFGHNKNTKRIETSPSNLGRGGRKLSKKQKNKSIVDLFGV